MRVRFVAVPFYRLSFKAKVAHFVAAATVLALFMLASAWMGGR